MKVENPVALRFILHDDIYLLNADKQLDGTAAMPAPLPAETQPVTETPPAGFNYLGKNLKSFLVLVHYPDLEFIKDTHLTALENILKRRELALDDVAILNMALHNMPGLDELLHFFKPQKLLLLGSEALPRDMTAPQLNTLQQSGSYTALYSFGFNEMMDNTDHKKAFWEQMKLL